MTKQELLKYIEQSEYLSKQDFDKFPLELQNDIEVLKTLLKKFSFILMDLSREHRSNPELLKAALEDKISIFNPIIYALPKALTKENIDLAMEQDNISYEEFTKPMLSNEYFVFKMLKTYPEIFEKSSKKIRKNKKIIDLALEIDINNFNYIPEGAITDELIEKVLANGYRLQKEKNLLISNYLNQKLSTSPNEVFNLVLKTDDEMLILAISQIFYKNKTLLPNNVKEKCNKLLNQISTNYKEMNFDETYINTFMNLLISGERSIFNFNNISNLKQLLYVIHFKDLTEEDEYFKLYIDRLSYDALTKTNIKQYNDIYKLLLSQKYGEFNSKSLAFSAYLTIGYQRSMDLFNQNSDKNYGPINIDKLEHLFGDIDLSEIVFIQEGNKFAPKLNEQLINLLYGQNYKIKNTPIRNFLNKFNDMKQYINLQIEKINADLDLTEIDKKKKIKKLNENYNIYCKEIRTFISKLSSIINGWDIIEEEFIRKQNLSKLNIKLNIPQINEIMDNLALVRKEIQTSNKQEIKKIRIPDYQTRDYPLLKSDLFDYVGIQNQYTIKPELAPKRAVELSRMMEHKTTKKFPNINLRFKQYTIKVFNPQDRNLISAGYRCGCCFRPNGTGDNCGQNDGLLAYCVNSEYGGGIEINDDEGKTLMFSPLLRNGNILMLHSFETIGINEEEKEIVNLLLKEWSSKVLEVSKEQENDEALIAVAITDLNSEYLDLLEYVCILPEDKKFKVYDPELIYKEMYNNLGANAHHIIEIQENKGINDIKYNYPVNKKYEYPINTQDMKVVNVNNEQLELIKEIVTIKNQISTLSNKKLKLIKSGNEELLSFEITRQIKELKSINIEKYKKLSSLSRNSQKDLLSEYIEGIENINYVCTQLGIENETLTRDFIRIYYCQEWYLGITLDNKLYGNFINGSEVQFYSVLSQISKYYNLNLETNLSNSVEKGVHRK